MAALSDYLVLSWLLELTAALLPVRFAAPPELLPPGLEQSLRKRGSDEALVVATSAHTYACTQKERGQHRRTVVAQG